MKNEAYYQAYLSHHHISRRGLLRHVFPATKSTIEKNANLVLPFQPEKIYFPPSAMVVGDALQLALMV